MGNLIIYEEGTPVLAKEAADKLADLQKASKQIEKSLADIKAKLQEEMKAANVIKIDMPQLVITYVPETTTERLDSKALKKDLPAIYNEYTTETKKAGYIKLTVREENGNMGD